ncbi:MAG: nitrilase-related carbon-nitrogen hydrolase, partial [Mariprofundaceae bacterium]
MRVALAQVAPEVGDLAGNVRRILDAAGQAARDGADLVVLPELAVTGYPPEDLLKRPAFMEAAARATREVVASSGEATLVFGAPRMGEDGRRYNSAVLARRGRLVGIYDKQRLPNYGVFDERRYFHPGSGERPVFEVGGWRVGVGICEDLWHDDLAEAQAGLACDVWLNLNASPFHAGKQAERERLVARRARQFGAPVVYLNPVGGQDEIVFDGGSHAADAEGRLMLRAPLFATWQGVLPLDAPGFESLAPMPDTIEQVHAALVLGVRDYVRRNGCRDVLIGLSGGIDSAVTAAIAAEALGREHVLGVLMPSRFSSEHSITDARALAANLGIETVTLPIQSGVDAIEAMLAPLFEAWGLREPDITEENIQDR